MSDKNCNTELSLSKGTYTIKNLNILLNKDIPSNKIFNDTKFLLNYYTKKEIDSIINSISKPTERILIIDNLQSNSTQEALSANLGRILDLKKADKEDLITDREIVNLIDAEINTRVPIINVNNNTLVITDRKLFNV